MPSEPSWLITDDFTDTELGTLKAGKEAQIFVVERSAGARSCLLARKQYIPLRVQKGDLEAGGFARARTFTRDAPYWEDKRMKKSAHREQRAMTKRTAFGRSLLFGMWAGQEYATLRRLWHAGVPVPYPVDHDGESVVMEYLGDYDRAAPQLVHARLGRVGLRAAYEQWISAMRLMVAEGLVHSDLSPYNILWWQDRLVIIDLPQAVDLLGHPEGFGMLHRDVVNVSGWFNRKGVSVEPDTVFAELVAAV